MSATSWKNLYGKLHYSEKDNCWAVPPSFPA